MAKIRSHYDNLKVARNAPDSVIKAAYKALCQTYHSDKFQGIKAEAEKIMKIVNASYEALIDPAKRAIHDNWIEEQESKTKQSNEKPQFKETQETAGNQSKNRPHEQSSWTEEELYALAVKELSSSTANQGIMAKAIVKANGDDKKVSAYYIELRVEALQAEIEEKCLNELINLGCKVSTSTSKNRNIKKWEIITKEYEIFEPANLKELRAILDYCNQVNDIEKLTHQLTSLGCSVSTRGKGINKTYIIRTKLNEL
jgi:hypothetical protein